jgi:hypothetical protein
VEGSGVNQGVYVAVIGRRSECKHVGFDLWFVGSIVPHLFPTRDPQDMGVEQMELLGMRSGMKWHVVPNSVISIKLTALSLYVAI